MSEKQSQPQDFEKTIEELESIVKEMEGGDLSLQVALEKFERGVTLAKHGQETLNAAEQKVKILLSNDENSELEDFQNDE